MKQVVDELFLSLSCCSVQTVSVIPYSDVSVGEKTTAKPALTSPPSWLLRLVSSLLFPFSSLFLPVFPLFSPDYGPLSCFPSPVSILLSCEHKCLTCLDSLMLFCRGLCISSELDVRLMMISCFQNFLSVQIQIRLSAVGMSKHP